MGQAPRGLVALNPSYNQSPSHIHASGWPHAVQRENFSSDHKSEQTRRHNVGQKSVGATVVSRNRRIQAESRARLRAAIAQIDLLDLGSADAPIPSNEYDVIADHVLGALARGVSVDLVIETTARTFERDWSSQMSPAKAAHLRQLIEAFTNSTNLPDDE